MSNNEFNDFWNEYSNILLAVLVAIFFIGGGTYYFNKIYAPKYEQLRYDTHKESEAFRDGNLRRIRDMKFEYESATDDLGKAGIRSTILHEVADYDQSKLPQEMKEFIIKLEKEAVEYRRLQSQN